MESVFLLWHTHYDEELEGGEDFKLIGVYSTKEFAELAKVQTSALPGFKDHLNGFEIVEYDLNKNHWTEGFATVDFRKK